MSREGMPPITLRSASGAALGHAVRRSDWLPVPRPHSATHVSYHHDCWRRQLHEVRCQCAPKRMRCSPRPLEKERAAMFCALHRSPLMMHPVTHRGRHVSVCVRVCPCMYPSWCTLVLVMSCLTYICVQTIVPDILIHEGFWACSTQLGFIALDLIMFIGRSRNQWSQLEGVMHCLRTGRP